MNKHTKSIYYFTFFKMLPKINIPSGLFLNPDFIGEFVIVFFNIGKLKFE
jgi:hypothetical protein